MKKKFHYKTVLMLFRTYIIFNFFQIIMDKMENPWNVHSIYEFQYFNCPTCNFKEKSKQEFVNHAYKDHSNSVIYLSNLCDADIVCPWDVKDTNLQGPPLQTVQL